MERSPESQVEVVSRHQPLLGTVVELTVSAPSAGEAASAESLIVEEIGRLERVFSVFDHDSELCRWRRGAGAAGPELVEVLGLAAQWRRLTKGAFNPLVGVMAEVWAEAADAGELPSTDRLERLAGAIRVDGAASLIGAEARGSLDLNAVAKGWIIDRAVDRVLGSVAVGRLMVNAGGDLTARGDDAIVVGVEDPARPYDNAAPLAAVRVGNRALATSGHSRRGWEIAGSWFSHVIDPRTAMPSSHVASASVIADDLATADVLATALLVLRSSEVGSVFGRMGSVGYLIAANDGSTVSNETWDELVVRRSNP